MDCFICLAGVSMMWIDKNESRTNKVWKQDQMRYNRNDEGRMPDNPTKGITGDAHRFRKEGFMRFKRIYIEITNTCNLHCSFCIQNHRTPHRMRVEEFAHILREIQPFTNYVYLHVLGEPLSHPDIGKMLQLCEEYGMQVNLTTNGTLLRACQEVLYNSRLRQVNVSLHSVSEHAQANYLVDVFAVCESLAAKGVHISYRLWNLQEHGLVTESEALLKQLMKHYHMPYPKRIHKGMRMDVGEYLHIHLESQFDWPSMTSPYVSDTGRCLGMRQMCAILSDGTLVPCCLDTHGDIALGNVLEQSFASIIASDRAKCMCDGFLEHRVVEALCQHCSYRLRFA